MFPSFIKYNNYSSKNNTSKFYKQPVSRKTYSDISTCSTEENSGERANWHPMRKHSLSTSTTISSNDDSTGSDLSDIDYFNSTEI